MPEPLTAAHNRLAYWESEWRSGSVQEGWFQAILADLRETIATLDAERQRAEALEQGCDDWKATAEAAMAEPQLKLLADRAERAEAQVERLREALAGGLKAMPISQPTRRGVSPTGQRINEWRVKARAALAASKEEK